MAEVGRVRRMPHVVNPIMPTWHMGSPSQVTAAALSWHAEAKTNNGKARRANQPCLASVVVSLPRERDDIWDDYRSAALAYLRRRYGSRVVGAAEHHDEGTRHVHVLLVPHPGEDFGVVADAYAASREARKNPGNSVARAWKRAQRKFADAFFEAVSSRFGLERAGKRRKRLERAVHLASRDAAKRVDQAKAAVEQARALIERLRKYEIALGAQLLERQAESRAALGQVTSCDSAQHELSRIAQGMELTPGEQPGVSPPRRHRRT